MGSDRQQRAIAVGLAYSYKMGSHRVLKREVTWSDVTFNHFDGYVENQFWDGI